MVGCAAPFCNNSTAKGYTMKIFPRDTKRRALWASNISKNWTPPKNAYLCEIHFAPTMWERRSDIRKLKPDAVPTIFGYFLKKEPTKIKNNVTQVSALTDNNKISNNMRYNNLYQPITHNLL